VNRCFFAALLLCAARAFAGPTDSAIVAAMKLPDAPSYAWKTQVVDDARTYDIVGQTDRATDYSLVTMPMVSAVRRRISRGSVGGNSENQTTALFKGDEKFVVQTDDGWRKPEEIAGSGEGGRGRPGGYGGGPPGGGSRGRRGAGRGFPGESDGRGPNYSNLQKTLSRPHEEIGIIVAGYTDLKMDGEVLSGPLTETAAKLLLVHAGQEQITPLQASGTFRIWVRNGILEKFETRLEGKLSVETSSGRREVTVHQTATTTLSDMGKTKVEVPDDAKKRLG
jgi:hypothetical protein